MARKMVLHGKEVTEDNVRKAVEARTKGEVGFIEALVLEERRVFLRAKPGGKVLVMDSCEGGESLLASNDRIREVRLV